MTPKLLETHKEPSVLSSRRDTMSVRGVRGAITICENDMRHSVGEQSEAEAILSATRELLLAILQANPSLRPEDIASVFFTTTDDLCSAFPAKAARDMGWEDVPLMCAQEIPVPNGIKRCVRVLLLWNTSLTQKEVHHIYLREAALLRPDLAHS
jgi:chorismate mutase